MARKGERVKKKEGWRKLGRLRRRKIKRRRKRKQRIKREKGKGKAGFV